MTDPSAQPKTFESSRLLKWGSLIVVYIFLLAVSALYWFPPVPRSTLGWVTFLLFAPPLFLLGEWMGDLVTRSWGELSFLAKAIKAALLIVTALVLIVAGAVLRGL